MPRLFEHLRKPIGDGVELLHDVHERLPPVQALGLAKALEPYHLFFLEDPLAPEDNGYFRIMRQADHHAYRHGRAFREQAEYMPLIEERLIDFIRVHISDIGGISACSQAGGTLRVLWHSHGVARTRRRFASRPRRQSAPRSGVPQLRHSGAACLQSAAQDVFPGTPEVRDGALWSNDRPGLGVELDEELAARFPLPETPMAAVGPPIPSRGRTIVRP